MKFLTGQFFFNTWNFFSPTAQIGSFSLAVLEALASRHYRGHLRFLLKPLDTIMLWYTRFFRRGMSSIEMRMMLYPLGRLYDWLSLRFVSGICGKIYFKIDHLWKVWGHEFKSDFLFSYVQLFPLIWYCDPSKFTHFHACVDEVIAKYPCLSTFGKIWFY